MGTVKGEKRVYLTGVKGTLFWISKQRTLRGGRASQGNGSVPSIMESKREQLCHPGGPLVDNDFTFC